MNNQNRYNIAEQIETITSQTLSSQYYEQNTPIESKPSEGFVEISELMAKCKEDLEDLTLLWKYQIRAEEEKLQKNEAILNELKETLQKTTMKSDRKKRKYWCCVCEKKAKYLIPETKYFYCSDYCEKKHKQSCTWNKTT